MTIGDFCYYAMDSQYVEIWSAKTGDVVWSGWSENIPDEYEDVEINTWNGVSHKIMGGGICFNID